MGHFQRFQYLIDRIRAATHEVAEMRNHIFGIRLSVYGRTVSLSQTHLFGKVEKLGHRFAAAGNVRFHFIDELFYAERHGGVQIFGAHYHAVRFGNLKPVYLVGHSEFVEQYPHVARVIRRAEVVQLVKRSLELEPAATEGGRKSAGQIVLFDDKRLQSALQKPYCRDKSAVARADYYSIVFCHDNTFPFSIYISDFNNPRYTLDNILRISSSEKRAVPVTVIAAIPCENSHISLYMSSAAVPETPSVSSITDKT